MFFFSKVREAHRDKTRDKLCAHLRSLGIEAQMAPRGRAEENIYTGPRESLGIIDIAKGPIPWVNVTSATMSVGGDPDRRMPYYLVYGVPDTRIGLGFPNVRVKAVSVKKFERGWLARLHGVKVAIGVRWEGEDFGLGIVQHLSQDVSLASAITDGQSFGLISEENPRDGPVEILAYPDRSWWMLTTKEALTPSKQEWDCYQSIASYLLGTPLQPST